MQSGEYSMGCLDIPNETIFTMEMTPIKFGPGATDEVAYDLKRLGVKHTLIITDRGIMQLGLADRVRTLIQEAAISADIFDEVHVEPTDQSFEAIAMFVRGRDYDGFVAVGGGSSIDSAKAANLFTTYPAPLMDYVNKPIGKGLPVPGPLKPLLALPTTAGTGSETTATAIMDILSLKMKTGISHRYLRPTLAIIDPLNTVTLPPMATAYPGFDVLTHALESYTSRPYARSTSAAIPSVTCGARRPWNIPGAICAGPYSMAWMWRHGHPWRSRQPTPVSALATLESTYHMPLLILLLAR